MQSKKFIFVNEGFKVYEQQHAIKDNFHLGDYHIDESKFEELSAFEVKANDIIISCSGTVGRVAIAPSDMEAGIINQALLKITLNESVLSNTYFKILFPAFYMKTDKLSDLSGTAQKNIVSVDELKKEPFPLPPLAEQHRIVAKANELIALCDQLEQQHSNAQAAHDTLVSQLLATLTQSQNATEFNANWQRIYAHFDVLFTTEASIDVLKQTLLQLAVMGKLVPQDPNDEPTSELLKRIQAEKAKLISEGKLKKEKLLARIGEDEKPFELPKRWEWVRFIDYAIDVSTGPFGSMIHKSDYINGGVPLINPSHMINDSIIHDTEITISHHLAEQLNTYKIFDGDIVMARRGEVGRIAVVREKQNGWICGTGSFVLRFTRELSREFLKIIFRNDYVRTYLAGEAVGTTMVNLNHTILKNMPIGIPPITEQLRIVAKVDALMALCDKLKNHIQQANQQQQVIVDALVSQAVT